MPSAGSTTAATIRRREDILRSEPEPQTEPGAHGCVFVCVVVVWGEVGGRIGARRAAHDPLPCCAAQCQWRGWAAVCRAWRQLLRDAPMYWVVICCASDAASASGRAQGLARAATPRCHWHQAAHPRQWNKYRREEEFFLASPLNADCCRRARTSCGPARDTATDIDLIFRGHSAHCANSEARGTPRVERQSSKKKRVYLHSHIVSAHTTQVRRLSLTRR